MTWLHIECPSCHAYFEVLLQSIKDLRSGTCLRCPKGTKLVVTDWGQKGRRA